MHRLPPQSLDTADVLLVASDGTAFRAHSQYLRSLSTVLRSLLQEHTEQLCSAASSGSLLAVPLDCSSDQAHLMLQVLSAKLQ